MQWLSQCQENKLIYNWEFKFLNELNHRPHQNHGSQSCHISPQPTGQLEKKMENKHKTNQEKAAYIALQSVYWLVTEDIALANLSL